MIDLSVLIARFVNKTGLCVENYSFVNTLSIACVNMVKNVEDKVIFIFIVSHLC